MAVRPFQSTLILRLNTLRPLIASRQTWRWQSSASSQATGVLRAGTVDDIARPVAKISFPLSRLSTSSILRSLFLSTFFTSSTLFKPGLHFMRTIANSNSPLLNPDKNPVLRAFLKPLVYDQFCAGTNDAEVRSTIADIKRLGFSGVILCYGKEAAANELDCQAKQTDASASDPAIEHWRAGNVKTLDMIGDCDWLGIKFTGAGQSVFQALVCDQAAPRQFVEAMDSICERAAAQGCRIWIDAEQQSVQTAIDKWTIDLMRKWNKGRKTLVYNTVQAYLKKSRTKLQYQLQLAHTEGWTLGTKLVRGAYISNDIREAIHDTKAETDASYDGIISDLLQATFPGFSPDNFPQCDLFAAGHNSNTIRKAIALARELSAAGKLKVKPEFGQLQGMADDIGCELLQVGDEIRNSKDGRETPEGTFVPLAYKCLTWGSIQECMLYLVRRAVENQGAADRMREGSSEFAKEVRRRLVNMLWRRSTVSP